MMVGRLVGWLLILAGIAVLVQDVMTSLDTRIWAPLALGQLWGNLDRTSLNFVQDLVVRYLSSFLWDPVITSLLFCWAFAVFIVLGLIVHHIFRERTSKSF